MKGEGGGKPRKILSTVEYEEKIRLLKEQNAEMRLFIEHIAEKPIRWGGQIEEFTRINFNENHGK